MVDDSLLDRFAALYPFSFDDFQAEALQALARGESVLVAAPTGSGKTVIGEFAVWLALQEGGKAFYTTPLKALSNQKFADLIARHGPDNVGLLTGDNSINPLAPVVVMTTEVLRNMIYERSDLLADLRYVILDEVHYLQDRYRGAVWEEVIIHLPLDVKIVSLSATVSNAEEFSDWIQTLRGTTRAIMEHSRPVKLRHHYLAEGQLYPMFVYDGDDEWPNPEIHKLEGRSSKTRRPRSKARYHTPRRRFPHRSEVVETLSHEGMLPAIYFIFSRKGCNLAVSSCMREGVVLTDGNERKKIRDHAERRCEYLDPDDLDVLGYAEWLEGLSAGVAAHHAGLIPAFKETVEELFQAGLVKVAFATETLSLGINMPARTVVIESLNKFTGERHEILTPGEFTQLTGRAGRRGIDIVGHAVVPRQNDIPFQQIAGLAANRTYPLISSFQPSYNMATNLVRNYTRTQAEHLLNSSFAQYRADKDVVVLEKLIERNDAYIASYHEKSKCEKGDFKEYWKLASGYAAAQKEVARARFGADRERTRGVLSALRPGQVLMLPSGKMRGPVVVVGSEKSKRGEPRLLALNASRRFIKLGMSDFQRPPVVVGDVGQATGGNANRAGKHPRAMDHTTRRKLASALQDLELPAEAWAPKAEPPASENGEHLRIAMLQHPCHSCPDRDRHSQWAERAARLEKENEDLRKRVRARTETLSRKFERILTVLEQYRYVEGFNLTEKGWALARIYNENDLLIAESLSRGWFNDLDAAELAALVSTFVFESRGPFEVVGALPTGATKKVYGKVVRLAERIKGSEAGAALDLTRGTEAGFAMDAFKWCNGETLDGVISEDSTPGDFIRSCKQTVDLLRQLRGVTGNPLMADKLTQAIEGMNRGVVAYTGVE